MSGAALPVAAAMEDFPAPCFLVAPDSLRIVWSNSAAHEWAEQGARALAARDIADVLAPLEGAHALVSRTSTERTPLVVRDVRYANIIYEVIFYPVREHVGIIVSPRRSTGPKARATHGESIRKLGQMMGHELKNPLSGIRAAAQLLRADSDTDEGRELLDLIVSEVGRLERLATRLQDFGDDRPRDPRRVNVHTLLRQARQLMTATAGEVLFTEDYDPSLPHVEGDSDQIMQALVNLIKNAVEAVDGAGEVTLRTRSRMGARRAGRHLPIEVQVIDSGPGIPEHMRDRVFEPFATSKPNGQGLGLALVAQVVEAHGGLVEINSVPGRMRVSMLLPAAAANPITSPVETP